MSFSKFENSCGLVKAKSTFEFGAQNYGHKSCQMNSRNLHMITIIGEEKLLSFESTGKIKHQIEHLNLAGNIMQYKNSGNECMIVIKNDGRPYFQVKDYIINSY